METGRRSGLLVAWTNAWLAGRVPLEDAVAAICQSEPHVVRTGDAVRPLARALPQLRAAGVQSVRLVVPVPGDVSGVPGPGPLTTAAVDAGEAVVAGAVGWVPAAERHGSELDGFVTSVTWHEHPVPDAPAVVSQVAEAEQRLREAVLEATADLRRLEVAQWRPEIAGELEEMRRRARRVGDTLPRDHPARAVTLLGLAIHVGSTVQLATATDGAAVTASEAAGRSAALRELARAVREACVAGYSAT